MLKKAVTFLLIFPIFIHANEAEVKKTYLEDIFIWRMSDELKLSAQDEKKFTEIQKNLNKKKAELNKTIQDMNRQMADQVTLKETESLLKKYRQVLAQYNQVSIDEFDEIKKLLGIKKFSEYLKIKAELTSKLKSMLVGEKEKKEDLVEPKSLPAPKVTIEKRNSN